MSHKKSTPSSLFSTGSYKKPRSNKRLVSIRLEEDLLRRLADVGNHEGLSMSDTIRVVLERGLSASSRESS